MPARKKHESVWIQFRMDPTHPSPTIQQLLQAKKEMVNPDGSATIQFNLTAALGDLSRCLAAAGKCKHPTPMIDVIEIVHARLGVLVTLFAESAPDTGQTPAAPAGTRVN